MSETLSRVTTIGLYSIYDVVAGKYGPPFCAASLALAQREARVLVMGLPEHIRKDYSLVSLGIFNDATGGIEPLMQLEVYDAV